MIKYAKTFSAVVDKLEICGWTLPSELGIYAVNVIGRTDGIIDIDKLLLWYFRENEYEHLKNMLNSILEAPIGDGLKGYRCDILPLKIRNLQYVLTHSFLASRVYYLLSGMIKQIYE